MKSVFRKYWMLLICSLIILILSGISGNKVNIEFEHMDKIVHFLMYFGLSFTYIRGIGYHYPESSNIKFWPIFIGSVAIILYGILMEILQNTVFVERSLEFNDMLANSFGAVIGILLSPILLRIKILRKLLFMPN